MIPMVVLDASALLAVALHERGRDVVLTHIKRSSSSAFIHSVNVFEVVTKLCRTGLSQAEAWRIMDVHDVLQVNEIEGEVLHIAVRIKLDALDLSLGDCFCIALAEFSGGKCITSDKRFLAAKTTATISLFRE